MFDIDGEINCILPDNKFGSESEYTERISVNNQNVNVTCNQNFLNFGILGFFSYFILCEADRKIIENLQSSI